MWMSEDVMGESWQMTVIMLTAVAGERTLQVGDAVLLPVAVAHAWITAGYAVPAPVPEAAMALPPERAMRPRAKGRPA
jgi:hypothetical protein